MAEKRFMDIGELSEYLGISKWLIYKFVSKREIPFIPFGRLVRFDRLAVDKWAEKRSVSGFSRRSARTLLTDDGPDYDPFEVPADILAEIAEEKARAEIH